MERRIIVSAHCRSLASPDVVFSLLSDPSTYPTWSGHDEYRMERPGRHSLHGVGEIRMLRTGLLRVREEIVTYDIDRKLGYRLLSGLPLHDYFAETRLEAIGDRETLIWWEASFNKTGKVTGWFWRHVIQRVIGRIARRLSVAAERHHHGL